MTYRVLARKWRPQTLNEVVGQDVVCQVLRQALQRQQLHHAYLFTGTRGVGKTSIARILAKCLNCEQGVTASPCGTCSACQSITDGCFPDLIEVDAASRTRVEETRDLLENVPYAPTQGRFKVYLIDEVHMLSGHSFNALLKTLEEPPDHVKFFLATTDPQRLPITILSRCMQLHLKALSADVLAMHLESVCQGSEISAEPEGLAVLAEAAQGSVRDALSLLEQAIAYGNGNVSRDGVNAMLGTTDAAALLALLSEIISGDSSKALEIVSRFADDGVIFEKVLERLISLLHAICIVQTVPDRANHYPQGEQLLALSKDVAPVQAQLLYQVALLAKRDFALALSPQSAFEMFVLRLCAFEPSQAVSSPMDTASVKAVVSPKVAVTEPLAEAPSPKAKPVASAPSTPVSREWTEMVPQLQLKGLTKVLAEHCSIRQWEGNQLSLALSSDQAACLNEDRKNALQKALADYLSEPVSLDIVVDVATGPTPATLKEAAQVQAKEALDKTIEEDTGLQALVDAFDATIEKITTETKEIES